jgi:hypothetical protein
MGLFSGLLGLSTAVDETKLMAEYGKYMIDGETIEIGFTLIRDTFVFTNKRLLLIDKQGLTGKKLEIFTIPYRSVDFFYVETAGTFEMDSELKIAVKGMPTIITKKFRKDDGLDAVYKVLSTYVLK